MRNISDTYQDVTLSQVFNINNSCNQLSEYSCIKGVSYRLYIGATFENKVNDMFSFFPCLSYQKNMNNGFLRPVIAIDTVIKNNLKQGFSYNFPDYENKNLSWDIQDNKKLWNEVKKQVESQGLKLGVYTKLPPKK